MLSFQYNTIKFYEFSPIKNEGSPLLAGPRSNGAKIKNSNLRLKSAGEAGRASQQRHFPIGGEGGIRTRETLARLRAFQARALGHYATSPDISFILSKNHSYNNYKYLMV